jgi:exodeoxyribonuclease V gamma subunit
VRSEPGQWAAVEYSASVLFPKDGLGVVKLLPLWVRQLAANAAGISLQSHLIGEDGIFSLPILSVTAAEEALEALVNAFRLGTTAPLPVAPRTALAYLKSKNSPISAAKKTFESSRFTLGEQDRSLYLRRAFPSFDALLQTEISGQNFTTLSTSLYQGLLDNARKTSA